ncbi:MAG: UMP kinase [Arsenophonus sp.]|nr:MAG: UMP kinase [Arsenophonus sp.]
MFTNTKPVYQRILLKISGEALQGSKKFGIDNKVLNRMANEIKKLVQLSIQVAVVIGGGNLFRGECLAKSGMNRVVGDHIGMLSTVINGLAMRDALQRLSINAELMSAIPLNGVCSNYSCLEAISLLLNGKVVIFSAGTGNPFFTTDSAACLRGIEIEANIVLKATKVDGIYSSDPSKSLNVVLYHKLTYQDVLERELKVMDLAAFTLARDHNLPIRIFNFNKPDILSSIVVGGNEGTLITNN